MAPGFLYLVWLGGVSFYIVIGAAGLWALYEWYKVSMHCAAKWPVLASGLLYIPLSFGTFLWLRHTQDSSVIFLLVAFIWASDIGAYFTGQLIGGPKMASKVSPNKTWAGLAGAVFWPGLAGLVFALFFAPEAPRGADFAALLFGMGAIIGLAGQGGDLLVSYIKRLAGVKDTGDIIPGHGGLLDRIDSLMLGTPVFFLILWAFPDVF